MNWRKIPGLPEHYEASPLGQIRRLPYVYTGTTKAQTKCARLLPQKIYRFKSLSTKGYQRVNLEGRVWAVHRLIALVFVPNPDGLPQINHKNGVKTDNRAKNLEWVSNQQNRDHAVATGLHPIGSEISKRLKESDIPVIRALAAQHVPQHEIAARFNVCQQTISHIVRRSTWQHVQG